MPEIRPLLPPPKGDTARFALFMSGSGTNAEKVLEHLRAVGDRSSCQAAAIVTDAPETSRARELGKLFDLPVVEHDIRAFYGSHGETRVSIATPRGQELRQAWTDGLRAKLADVTVDFGVFAGFVPLTNLTGDFPCLNVHPGDLTYRKDGARWLVGLHTVPIERAILEGLDILRTSVIQALPYTGKGDDMDNGPILGLSPEVEIDLEGCTVEELVDCAAKRPEKRPKGGYGDRLEELAQFNQEKLKVGGDWVVLPRVVVDFGQGRFGLAPDGQLHYRMGANWHPIETVVYETTAKEIVFAEP
jgi:folate-dependent phosphoribosylglycinamide formyltransferase PurN